MIYLGLKALHLLAMVVWLSGMLSVPIILSIKADRLGDQDAVALRRLFGRTATPGMVAVWVLGLLLAQAGGWLTHSWLIIKIIIVVGLSGLHGAISGQLRRLEAGSPVSAFLRSAHWPVLAGAAGIIVLAVFKPS